MTRMGEQRLAKMLEQSAWLSYGDDERAQGWNAAIMAVRQMVRQIMDAEAENKQ